MYFVIRRSFFLKATFKKKKKKSTFFHLICFLHPGQESEMSLFSPPSLHSSLAVLLLNRCIQSVKSSLEVLPAAYWFIINEIRTFECQGGFCPIVGWIVACQEDLLFNRRGHRRNKDEQKTDIIEAMVISIDGSEDSEVNSGNIFIKPSEKVPGQVFTCLYLFI